MPPFKSFDKSFARITGPDPELQLLLQKDYPFAFEAGIYFPTSRELFVTSSPFDDAHGKTVHISKITLGSKNDGAHINQQVLPNGRIAMANGGTKWGKEMIFCAQGSLALPSGLFAVSESPPHDQRLIVSDFYGRPFNSVNDVVVHSDGSIWFTDPAYGFGEGHRPRPRLPNQIYRYDPKNGAIRVVADGIAHPNGLCFSPDETIMYITDTDFVWGDGTEDESRASTIYAFDISLYSGQPFLTNRRVFAMADTGYPDGIKCDSNGNVYSGCGDGVHVWSPGGVLLGKILVDGGVANLCFGGIGELFILNGTKLWRARLADSTQGALL
ncbi:gluconolactonase [Boeremia exigua]|uniref:gluconolactonase n=1 Tax=Boeremia exigua TaxID=749465 RepID=UPI001E8CAEF7|nr:gluconolactonase [Boeremia exigua]KAH6628990.1 gluconolactonase [Boeremia exigua]